LMHKQLRTKKAISPILATLLLIVIAVAAIVVTYAWIMTYMGNAGNQAGVMLFKSNVRFYNNGTSIDIDIGNSGTSGTQISQVYFGTSSGNMQNMTTSQTLPVPLAAGATTRITLAELSPNCTLGATYYFKVVTSSGQMLPPWPEQTPDHW
jgi:archaeal type IV pilus assembly protein PilA